MPEGAIIIVVSGMVFLTIRSLIEAWASRRELPPDTARQDRLLRLEDEMDALRKTVAQLEEAEDFRKALNPP